jgi:hypothetical protein
MTIREEKVAALYHVVRAREDFDTAARHLVAVVREAETKMPGKERHLYLDIEGHRNSSGGFEEDMVELQQRFVLSFLMPYLKSAHMPLATVENPRPQDNAVPEALDIVTAH